MDHCEPGKKKSLNQKKKEIIACIQVEFHHTIVSSIGYVVLSGKIQVDKHETTFLTFVSNDVFNILSFIWQFTRFK